MIAFEVFSFLRIHAEFIRNKHYLCVTGIVWTDGEENQKRHRN